LVQVPSTCDTHGTAGGLASFPPLIQIDARSGSLFFDWHELSGSATNVKDESRYHKLKPLKDMKGVWTDISFCLDFKNNRIDAWVDGIKKVEILKSPIFSNQKQYILNMVYIVAL
jgi:hypothetical protein